MEELCSRSKLCFHIWQGQGDAPGKLRPAILEVSRERAPAGEGQCGVGGGHGRQDPYFPPVPTMGNALAPDQPRARCSIQTSRKEPREMLLSKCKFLAVPYSRRPWPSKTDQREWCPQSGLTESTLPSSSENHGRRNEKGRTSKVNAARMFSWGRGVALKIILPLRRLGVQWRKMICPESQAVAEPGFWPKSPLHFLLNPLTPTQCVCLCVCTLTHIYMYI